MTDRNEALVRKAYEAYGRGEIARMLEFVDPELEWTYLNPAFENPEPETCHGRDQLTLDQERIIRMRACRNRDEARSFAGIT